MAREASTLEASSSSSDPPHTSHPVAAAAAPMPLSAAEAEAGQHFKRSDSSTNLRATEDTSSEYLSELSSDGHYEVIEYDLGENSNMLDGITIQDDSPAAEALRANANVKVSGVGKAARAVHLQSVRRWVKRASMTQRSGYVKGKPPRLPPQLSGNSAAAVAIARHESEELDLAAPNSSSLEPIWEAKTQDHPSKIKEDAGDEDASNKEEEERKAFTGIPAGVVPGTAEAGKKVLGNVDPHDLLKLLRWKRKSKDEAGTTPKSYVKGKVIDGEHELYTLSIAVMIGVRTSISRTNSELNHGPGKRWVSRLDFRSTEKYEFRPRGGGKGGLLPPHQLAHTFKFKDYAPVVFSYLRRMAGVNEFDFLLSVCGNANFIEFISNAKSGQFFFYSQDGRYMIKTMTNAESKFLRRSLPDYFRHCAENPNTTISRFFGMYRVKMYHLRRNVKFVVMNSVYYTDKYLQSFYDLKGSVLGRNAKPGDAVQKDNDLRKKLPEDALAMAPQVRLEVRTQLESDCAFLNKISVMDYSMLVGIHHVPYYEKEEKAFPQVGYRATQNRSSLRTNSYRDLFDEGGLGNLVSGLVGGAMPALDPLSSSMRSAATPPTTIDISDNSKMESKGHIRSHSSGNAHAKKHIRTHSVPNSRDELTDKIGSFFYDDGLDDDDNSYLEGSDRRPAPPLGAMLNDETERQKQVTLEKLYWPFHRWFDIHGHRLIKPAKCWQCSERPCACVNEENAELLKGYNIPQFVPPLSDRKDGGFEMDTTGLKMPRELKASAPGGATIKYQGKIFYMGLIDILQEFNTRKVLEAQYRSFGTGNRLAASCVPPMDYAERFLDFFDEYTQRIQPGEDSGLEIEFQG